MAKRIDDNRLLPCPFCGEPAAIWYLPQHERPLLKEAYYVGCTNDNCGCELDYPGGYKSRDDAVSAWNRRPLEQEPATKNNSSELEKNSKKLEEPQTFKWCTDCREYDQEKHCCHRWSKVIRNTVAEMKQEQEPILDKIKAEIETKYGHCDICEYFEDYDFEENDISEYRPIGDIADILQIIDKYKAESEA